MAERRTSLAFDSYAAAAREIERLLKSGYTKTGSWSLGQICRHLSFYLRGSLDGFPMMLPWIVRATFGRLALKQSLKPGLKKPGSPTAPQSVYPDDTADREAAAEAVALLERLEKHTGPLHPSALFGDVTPEQWKILHLNHAAHHLSFLV